VLCAWLDQFISVRKTFVVGDSYLGPMV